MQAFLPVAEQIERLLKHIDLPKLATIGAGCHVARVVSDSGGVEVDTVES